MYNVKISDWKTGDGSVESKLKEYLWEIDKVRRGKEKKDAIESSINQNNTTYKWLSNVDKLPTEHNSLRIWRTIPLVADGGCNELGVNREMLRIIVYVCISTPDRSRVVVEQITEEALSNNRLITANLKPSWQKSWFVSEKTSVSFS